MTAIEKQLGVETSANIFQDISPKTLESAAEMFLYLYSCPHFADTNSVLWFKRWIGFYKELFETAAPDTIILTLHRMIKQDVAGSSQEGKVHAVWKATGTLLSLKFEQIQSLLPGTVSLKNSKHNVKPLFFKHKFPFLIGVLIVTH